MKITRLVLTIIMILALASFAVAEDVMPDTICQGIFNDVTEATVGLDFCRYIEKLYDLQIVAGCGGGNYCPNDPVNRKQLAVFILESLQLLTNNQYPFELTNSQYPALRLDTTYLPYGVVDTAYDEVVFMTAGGGTNPYVFDCSLIDSVAGIATIPFTEADGLSGSCTISGTPTDPGKVTVKFMVTDSTTPSPYIDQHLLSFNVSQSAVQQFTLSVSKGGTGTGTVTGAGINCGSDCSETVDEGTMITLSANPGAGSTFAGWSGGGCSGIGNCSVTMNSNLTVIATFNVTGGGGGEVTLENNVPLNLQSIDYQVANYYKFYLDAGITNVSVYMGTNDWTTNQDMIVSYGLPKPTPDEYPKGQLYFCTAPDRWCTISPGTSNESIEITSPQSGWYYIMVYNTGRLGTGNPSTGLYEIYYSAY